MRLKCGIAVLFLAVAYLFLAVSAHAWEPGGWVNHSGSYAYSSAEGVWYYMRPGDTQWRVNLNTGVWSQLDGTAGWNYYNWPYAYSNKDGAWYWNSVADEQWCANMQTGEWSLFGVPSGMAALAGGAFIMGDSWGAGGGDETPVHIVELDPFYMDRHEVTNAEMVEMLEWARVRGKLTITAATVKNAGGDPKELLDLDDDDCEISWSGSAFMVDSGRDDHPCVEVSWYGAAAYCNYRSESEGYTRYYNLNDWSTVWTASGYRLPTEAEWEYAAKGGQGGDYTLYSGSDDVDAVAWYSGNSGWTSHAVGSKNVNEAGIYDLSGNVWEWCNDWFDPDYYGESPTDNPQGPATGTTRVQRGGGWGYNASYSRVSERIGGSPGNASFIGFRSVRAAN